MRARTKKAITQTAQAGAPSRARRPVRATRGQKLRYAFDNSMSRGTSALVAWLGVLTLGLILLSRCCFWPRTGALTPPTALDPA